MLRRRIRACFTSGAICRNTDLFWTCQRIKKSGALGAGESMSSYSDDLHSAALAYHRLPRPGKLEIQAIKPLANQRDLALAYSPGVAAACIAIADNPAEAASLTTRANLVAVVSNGTAVLGLGNIGPLAVEAGDGRQGGSVQEVRRHRRVRHRNRRRYHRARGRNRGRAGADFRRHQSRGHQGARNASRSRRSSRSA